jgi:hypothetical protein
MYQNLVVQQVKIHQLRILETSSILGQEINKLSSHPHLSNKTDSHQSTKIYLVCLMLQFKTVVPTWDKQMGLILTLISLWYHRTQINKLRTLQHNLACLRIYTLIFRLSQLPLSHRRTLICISSNNNNLSLIQWWLKTTNLWLDIINLTQEWWCKDKGSISN